MPEAYKWLVSDGKTEMTVISDSEENAKGHFLKVVEGSQLSDVRIVAVVKEKK